MSTEPLAQAELRRVLAAPLEYGAERTVGDYLIELLANLWTGEADAKYGMTGDPGWRYDVYDALRDAGIVEPWDDRAGIEPRERRVLEALIVDAIRSLKEERS